MARMSITSGYYGDGTNDHYGSAGTGSVITDYIPQLYAKKTLVKFYKDTVFGDITNTDYQGQFKNVGDSIIIRSRPDITVNTYSVGETLTYEVPESASQTMVIDQALYTAFKIDDIDAAMSDLNLQNEFAADAAEQISSDSTLGVDKNVLTLMGNAGAASTNRGLTAGALSGNINLGVMSGGNGVAITVENAIDYIVYMNQVFDEANVPSENRFVVLPAWYVSLLKTGDLRRADITGDGSGVIRTGLIGQIDRTKIYMNNNLYTGSDGTRTTTAIIAGTKHAASFAMAISKSDTMKNPNSFGTFWRTLYVFGRKIVKPEALVNLVAYKG